MKNIIKTASVFFICVTDQLTHNFFLCKLNSLPKNRTTSTASFTHICLIDWTLETNSTDLAKSFRGKYSSTTFGCLMLHSPTPKNLPVDDHAGFSRYGPALSQKLPLGRLGRHGSQ
jgi:hypothetical protein